MHAVILAWARCPSGSSITRWAPAVALTDSCYLPTRTAHWAEAGAGPSIHPGHCSTASCTSYGGWGILQRCDHGLEGEPGQAHVQATSASMIAKPAAAHTMGGEGGFEGGQPGCHTAPHTHHLIMQCPCQVVVALSNHARLLDMRHVVADPARGSNRALSQHVPKLQTHHLGRAPGQRAGE